ncbi:MAG: hypothetical protein ACKOQ0_06010 [Solirubrobacterales bacterium]
MKWLVALVVLCAGLAVSAAVYVVLWNRDPVPNEVGACLRKAKLPLVRSADGLSAFRAEIRAVPGLQPTRRWNWGRTRGLLYEVSGNRFALLALWNDRGPSLAGRDAARKIYRTPARYSIVSVETPNEGRLELCAEQASG